MTGGPGMRFSPPADEPSIEARWLLAAAFGPRLPALPAEADAGALAELAKGLDFGARIASRQTATELSSVLGDELANGFRDARRRAAAATLLYEELALRVAATAAELGLPIAFLKGFALHHAGFAAPGSRSFCDLDLLAPSGRALELQGALVAGGWTAAESPPNEHHLPALVDAAAGAVEIHFRLWGVSLRGGDWATLEDLEAAGLTTPAPGVPGGALLPARELLAAHAIAHGVAQHGSRPQSYPPLKLFADLADLLPDRASWQRFLDGPARWVEPSVSRAEVEATARLAGLLAAGRIPAGAGDRSAGEDDAVRLLRHLLAGAADAEYRESLRLAHLAERFRQARRQGALWSFVARKLHPTEAELEARYGPAATPFGRLGRRLRRSLEAVVELGRAAGAAGRSRGARRRRAAGRPPAGE